MSRKKQKIYPVVDLFSGAGGLGEGFYATGRFDPGLSVEMDSAASATLKLRKFFRSFTQAPDHYYEAIAGNLSVEDLYAQFPDVAKHAGDGVMNAELGDNDFTHKSLPEKIRTFTGNESNWVLVGGPPCQAYSKVGRARNKGVKGYTARDDKRHYLYREYLKVLGNHWPAVFVMENVPGLLSTKIDGESMFHRILEDLQDPAAALNMKHAEYEGYQIYSLSNESMGFDLFNAPVNSASDFIIKAEEYGIPQSRHRVILVGVRSDIELEPELLKREKPVTVEQVIGDLPRLRSGLSKGDSDDVWLDTLRRAPEQKWFREVEEADNTDVVKQISKTVSALKVPKRKTGSGFLKVSHPSSPKVLSDWYADTRLKAVAHHESRRHMPEDLYRYLYASCFVAARAGSQKKSGDLSSITSNIADFPRSLLPAHKNVQEEGADLKKVAFANRFQVQRAGAPSSTVVSHISRDGHYYIHYDATQCRSLTVREAARLQTFPDNYFFCGNRSEQYQQVGNAVPPLLAYKIAQIVMNLLDRHGQT